MYLDIQLVERGFARVRKLMAGNADFIGLQKMTIDIKKMNKPVDSKEVSLRIKNGIAWLNRSIEELRNRRAVSIRTAQFKNASDYNDAILDILGCDADKQNGYIKAAAQMLQSNDNEVKYLLDVCAEAENLIKNQTLLTYTHYRIKNAVPSHVKGHKKLAIGRMIYSDGSRSYFLMHEATNVPVCTKHAFSECSKSELADYLWSDSQALKKDVVCPRCAAAADDQ